jgi:hypothetical protein
VSLSVQLSEIVLGSSAALITERLKEFEGLVTLLNDERKKAAWRKS